MSSKVAPMNVIGKALPNSINSMSARVIPSASTFKYEDKSDAKKIDYSDRKKADEKLRLKTEKEMKKVRQLLF